MLGASISGKERVEFRLVLLVFCDPLGQGSQTSGRGWGRCNDPFKKSPHFELGKLRDCSIKQAINEWFIKVVSHVDGYNYIDNFWGSYDFQANK